jgi:hypothetical protein
MEYTQDIFWNNIPNTKGRIYKKLGFLEKKSIKNTFLKDLKNPYYIWTGCGRIHQLENIILIPKIQNSIRRKEIYFFLYEPICIKINDSYNRSFYSEFGPNDDLSNIMSEELESIKIFVKNNNIDNFRIFTSDYNIQLIQTRYPDLKINCLDIFLRDVSRNYSNLLQLRARPVIANNNDWLLQNNITKKFWCGNWRYAIHRHIIMSYLATIDGVYTWNLKCSYEELEKNNWFDLKNFEQTDPVRYTQLKTGVDYLYNNIFVIDQNIDAVVVKGYDEVVIPGNNAPMPNKQFLQSYISSFCGIINETRFAQPFGYFSEKTLTALYSKIPIVLVAPPYTLEYLRTFGFKTFDKWWDESYDIETNHHKRIIKIFEVIDYINSKSIEELKKIYSEMAEILNHNQEITKTIQWNDKIL